jgi:hypothetical protein
VVVGLKRLGLVGSTSKAAAWAWLSGWGPIGPGTGGHGDLGTAVLVDRASLVDMKELDDHYITISHVQPGTPLLSFVGAGWTSSRDFAGAEDWWRYLDECAQRFARPLLVQVLATQAGSGTGPRSTAPGEDSARWSARMAESVLRRHAVVHQGWDYTAGLVLLAIENVGRRTGDPRSRLRAAEHGGGADGRTIRTYQLTEFNPTSEPAFPPEATGDQRY